MYARVLVEGPVSPGDAIGLLPPAADLQAELHERLDRVEAAWRGFDAGTGRPSPRPASTSGWSTTVSWRWSPPPRSRPHLQPRARLPRAAGTSCPGCSTGSGPTGRSAGSSPRRRPGRAPLAEDPGSLFVAGPTEVAAATLRNGAILPAGVTTREIDATDGADAATFATILLEASPIPAAEARAWRGAIPGLVGAAGQHHFLVEADGAPVGVANLFVRRKVGILGLMAVLPAARGRGIQRALIALRAARAAELGATIVAAGAGDGSISAANLAASGLQPVWHEAFYRFDPATRQGVAA